MWKRVMTLALWIMPVGLLFLVSCDEDCPTCPLPNPPEEIHSDYNVILGASHQPFFVFNTKTKTIVDVIELENMDELQDLAMSGDGRHLLISGTGRDWSGTLVYDLETGEIIRRLYFVANMKVSNSGRYVACNTWGPTYFLDGQNYDIVDSVASEMGLGSFSSDGSRYCYISGRSTINIYNLESHSLDTSFTYVYDSGDTLELYRVQIDPSGRKLYMFTFVNPFGYLLGYSMDLDSTTFIYRLGIPNGDLQITPDGRQIICTDPGDIFFESAGTGHIMFIDVTNDAVTAIVEGASSISGGRGFYPGQLAITPDSRYSIVACAEGCGAFGMIDNDQHKFVSVIADTTAPYWLWTRCVTCQKLPN